MMLYDSADELEDAVVRSLAGAADARLAACLSAVVRHAHAAIREAGITRDELMAGVEFLRRAGAACTATHHELVLLADIVGLSSQALLQEPAGDTPSSEAALLGPFYRDDVPVAPNGADIERSDIGGTPLHVSGRVVDGNDRPVEGALVDVWQSSPCGLYDVQDDRQPELNLRARFATDAQGRFWFRTVRPAGYPVPTHGPSGELLRLLGRSAMRPAHIHFLVFREGFETLITQYFLDDPANLEADAVFGARRSLVGSTSLMPGPDTCFPDARPGSLLVEPRFQLRAGTAVRPLAPIR